MAHTIASDAARPVTCRHNCDVLDSVCPITKKSQEIGLPQRRLQDDSLSVFSKDLAEGISNFADSAALLYRFDDHRD